MQAKVSAAQTSQLSKHQRLISFENSNSFLKRHDSEGTLVIQAGYRQNPSDAAFSDDENPIVILDNQRPRWYGSLACQGPHVRSFERSKIETARESFAACLRESDHGKDLTVVTSHWDIKDFPAMKEALLGAYNVIRNGRQIQTVVTSVSVIAEGVGSFYAVQTQLKPGQTLLLEIGFKTAEEWILDEQGRILDGRPVSQLGILNLVAAIANDPTIRSTLSTGDRSDSINLSLLSAGLQKASIGRLSADTWKNIKTKYTLEYLKSLKGYLRSQYASQSQAMSNTVLTGGGAGLLTSVAPNLSEFFTIPPHPQTASLRGTYEFYAAKVGV